jgi:hypothetical protein
MQQYSGFYADAIAAPGPGNRLETQNSLLGGDMAWNDFTNQVSDVIKQIRIEIDKMEHAAEH